MYVSQVQGSKVPRTLSAALGKTPVCPSTWNEHRKSSFSVDGNHVGPVGLLEFHQCFGRENRYAVEENDDELIIEMGLMEKTINIVCCKKFLGSVSVTPELYKWNHFCVSLNLKARKVQVLYNDVFTELETEDPTAVRGGGRLVVGQELDSTGGGFDVHQILDGRIADYRFYTVALSIEEMRDFVNFCHSKTPKEPLLDLLNGKLQSKGSVTMLKITEHEIRKEDSRRNILFPYKMDYERAVKWCRKINGTLSVPRSKEENTWMYDNFLKFNQHCTGLWRNQYWIGVLGNLSSNLWVADSDQKPITYGNFYPDWGKPSAKFQCLSMIMEPYMWSATACSTETCVVCNFTRTPTLRLRGLCSESLLDRTFSIGDYEDKQLALDGQTHTRIIWAQGTWRMESRLYENLEAWIVGDKQEELPVGVHTWQVRGDVCEDEKMQLLLTFCGKDLYTCNDGTCISMDGRCNQRTDCDDQSDEMNCSLIRIPAGYSNRLPPPTMYSDLLPIAFSINITSIREINLVSSTVTMDVVWQLRWADGRLRYFELHHDYRTNRLRDSQVVWKPEITLRDDTHSSVDKILHSDFLYVLRAGLPLPDDDTTISEDDEYKGSENILVQEQEVTLTVRCQFDLQMYPFDQQRCAIVIKIQDLSADFFSFIKEGPGVMYLGNRRLLEYHVVGETFSILARDGTNYLRVELKFRNLYGFYLSNTFLPTFMLVFICCTTLCFDINDFQDRIMVSLTSLLVMATIFVQTSENITKTSYLKFIDLWFVAMMSEDFFIILGLVVVEVLRMREEKRGLWRGPARELLRAATVNKIFLVIFFASLVTMLCCFMLLCYLELNKDG
ncbi:uncharacterized protein LOC125028711 [Penaeus chinensis]|uniref:uncharacterized protein LOC125028711 n=1 Tax=Penaeus chinensis TaxID=139456 RepID=UPI001FB7663C|nr:uncharacterized protein LOC125028711 [Penaeus chinensis]